MTPKNVAFLIFSDGIGGAEKVVQRLSHAAALDGNTVTIIVNEEIFCHFNNECNKAKVLSIGKLYNIPWQKRFQKLIDLAKLFVNMKSRVIDKIIVENNIQVVFSNLMYDLNYLSNTQVKVLKIAVIHGAVGIDPKLPKYVFTAEKALSLLQRQNYIICVSEAISKILCRSHSLESKVFTINNGTNISNQTNRDDIRKKPQDNNPVLNFLFCGGDKPVKGGLLLKNALVILFERSIRLKICIAGPIKEGSFWYELSNRYPDKVNVLGFLSEQKLISEMESTDCIVMPSVSEGDPLVAIDAVALNKPILATDIDAFKTIVPDEYRFDANENSLVAVLQKFVISLEFREEYKFLKKSRTWEDVWFDYSKVIENDYID